MKLTSPPKPRWTQRSPTIASAAEAKVKGQKKLPAANDVGLAKAALEEAERRRNAAEDARRQELRDGGRHVPHQPEPVDMDKLIRARAGKGPQPMGNAPNGIPLSLE